MPSSLRSVLHLHAYTFKRWHRCVTKLFFYNWEENIFCPNEKQKIWEWKWKCTHNIPAYGNKFFIKWNSLAINTCGLNVCEMFSLLLRQKPGQKGNIYKKNGWENFAMPLNEMITMKKNIVQIVLLAVGGGRKMGEFRKQFKLSHDIHFMIYFLIKWYFLSEIEKYYEINCLFWKVKNWKTTEWKLFFQRKINFPSIFLSGSLKFIVYCAFI